MNELIEMQRFQIEALQKLVVKKDSCLQEAKRLLTGVIELIEKDEITLND